MSHEITKSNLSKKAETMISQMQADELVVRGKAMQEIGKEIYNYGKESILEKEGEGFQDKYWNGVKIAFRAGRTSYTFHDEELEQMQADLKKLHAKIKARQTYLKEAGEEGKEYDIKEGSAGISVHIP